MKILNFFALVFLIAVSFTCTKKKYPDSQVIVGEAAYYSKLTINNSPVTIEAGVNGYYMYSSFEQDSNHIYKFIGDLKQLNCSDCPNSLKVQINDYRVTDVNDVPYIDSSIQVTRYPYQAGDFEPTYSVQFQSFGTSNASYRWDFGDGTSSTFANPSKIYSKAGRYNVCLTTTNANSCASSICNKQKIDVSDASCKTSVKVTSSFGNTINFGNISYGGGTPYQYLWNFGDGATSTESEPSHTYKYRGSYPVSLRIVDYYGDTAVANYNAKTINDLSSCATNYSTAVTQIPPKMLLSHIVVTWIDADGKVYSSNNSLQPSDGYFEIVSISEGEKNESGQPTKKIEAKFKCRVYNGSQSLTINDAQVVMCVAYKK